MLCSLCVMTPPGNCNGDSMCRDDFYSDPVAVGYYKDHVKKLLNRVNTFNQRLYRYLQACMPGLYACPVSVVLCLRRHCVRSGSSTALRELSYRLSLRMLS